MSKETIAKIKKQIGILKKAASDSAKLLTDLSSGEYEPGEDVVSEVPLVAHQLQRYADHLQEQLQYAGKEPEEIAAEKQQEKEEAIAKMQEAAAEQLMAWVKTPEPEAEPMEEETEDQGGESDENPADDQPEHPDDQKQEDAESAVA